MKNKTNNDSLIDTLTKEVTNLKQIALNYKERNSTLEQELVVMAEAKDDLYIETYALKKERDLLNATINGKSQAYELLLVSHQALNDLYKEQTAELQKLKNKTFWQRLFNF
jgi:predicted MarR family transcription regulator